MSNKDRNFETKGSFSLPISNEETGENQMSRVELDLAHATHEQLLQVAAGDIRGRWELRHRGMTAAEIDELFEIPMPLVARTSAMTWLDSGTLEVRLIALFGAYELENYFLYLKPGMTTWKHGTSAFEINELLFANGNHSTESWSLTIETLRLKNGPHKIVVDDNDVVQKTLRGEEITREDLQASGYQEAGNVLFPWWFVAGAAAKRGEHSAELLAELVAAEDGVAALAAELNEGQEDSILFKNEFFDFEGDESENFDQAHSWGGSVGCFNLQFNFELLTANTTLDQLTGEWLEPGIRYRRLFESEQRLNEAFENGCHAQGYTPEALLVLQAFSEACTTWRMTNGCDRDSEFPCDHESADIDRIGSILEKHLLTIVNHNCTSSSFAQQVLDELREGA